MTIIETLQAIPNAKFVLIFQGEAPHTEVFNGLTALLAEVQKQYAVNEDEHEELLRRMNDSDGWQCDDCRADNLPWYYSEDTGEIGSMSIYRVTDNSPDALAATREKSPHGAAHHRVECECDICYPPDAPTATAGEPRYEPTGEFRLPRKGEWYRIFDDMPAIQAGNDHLPCDTPRFILRPAPPTATAGEQGIIGRLAAQCKVVPGASGGVVLEWHWGDTEEQLRVWDDGQVDYYRFEGVKCVERRTLQEPATPPTATTAGREWWIVNDYAWTNKYLAVVDAREQDNAKIIHVREVKEAP